ncbi:MAG TPA: histidine kinase dimerization/phosphoacceptor domain -containing protein [Spirochaetota bacterium]|nr:histidine kinase dimerization/phosphoacceptor domain -containing protein [Spirochaetota bacterium]
MFGKTRVRIAIFILVGSVGIIALTENYMLYRNSVEARALVLRGTAEHWASVINSVILLQRSFGVRDDAILKAVHDMMDMTHQNFGTFIPTGEFVLARKEGDRLRILVAQSGDTHPYPETLPIGGRNAIPAQRAVTGKTGGIIEARDLRGETVFAAYQPVGLLDLGVVVKIDLDEMRMHFIRAAALTMAMSTGIIFAGIIFIVMTERAAGRKLVRINEELSAENRKRRDTEAELQRANEELLTMNEEVTGAIEELETTNRELTSSQNEIERNYRELHDKETQIMKSLEEKEILLRELYHRTKNNMQVICGLLHLQSTGIDESTREILRQTEDRIMAMALVHKKLYQSQNLAELPFDEYIRDLLFSIKESFHPSSDGVVIRFNMERINTAIETAVPCGLVLNELISNSFKHAFDGREERIITVGLSGGDDGYIIEYADSGKGFPSGIDPRSSKSLGCRLVFMIVESQLRGVVEYKSGDGLLWRITVPVEKT